VVANIGRRDFFAGTNAREAPEADAVATATGDDEVDSDEGAAEDPAATTRFDEGNS
jgi:hypothetical protein